MERANGGRPVEAGTNESLVPIVGNSAGFGPEQMRECLQAAIASGDIVIQRRKIHVAGGRNQGVRTTVVVRFHAIVKGLDCALWGSGPLLLSRGSGASRDQHGGDDEHQNR